MDDFENILCFPTFVYHSRQPVFFERVQAVALGALSENRVGIDDVYPVKMSKDISQEPAIQDFCEYVAKSAIKLLAEQGYDVNGKAAYFESMWCQEHHQHSMMEQHVHPGDVQIIGFYFLDTPENCSVATFHDPRAGKVQTGRTEANMGDITYASNAFHFKPEAGQLLLTNSWLPHSFTRQRSVKPFRFLHFNVALTDNMPAVSCKPADEII